jgi:hypothetical protein
MSDEYARSDSLYLQLAERDAKILSFTAEINRLNECIKKKNRGLEEAIILADKFEGWIDSYFSVSDQARGSMLSQKRLDLTKLSTFFKEARNG